jgi:hypothetical protein
MSCSLWLGSQHEHSTQVGLWRLGWGPIGSYPSLIATGRLHYDATLRHIKGCVHIVPKLFDLGWFRGHGYGSSSANLHHPREVDKKTGIINMKVDKVHDKFIYHPKNLACCWQIWVHRYAGLRRIRCMKVLPEHMRNRPQSWNRRSRNAMTPDKKPSATKNFSPNFFQRVRNATSAATRSLVVSAT